MIKVVLQETNEILYFIDAWMADGEKTMRRWISEHGYVLLDIEYTLMGDMIMWIA